MRKITYLILTLALLLGLFTSLWGTVLIDPAGDGGFESGTTFAANGWTAVGTTGNQFRLGTYVPGYGGNRCAFVSNSATAWTSAATAAYRHIYRNVTFPANETEITLTFLYKTNIAQATPADGFTVRLVTTGTTPTTTGYPAGDLIYDSLFEGAPSTNTSWYVISISVPASYAGTTSRLVFSWYNNATTPLAVGALEEIELTSKVPATVSTLPYSTDMTPVEHAVSLPSGWSHIKSTANQPWIIGSSTSIGFHSSPHIALVFYSAAAKNEWMISPPISVVSGSSYMIKYWVKAPGYAGVPERLKVHWGTAPTVASMTANTAIYTDANMLITDWTEVTINYTATTTGNIYFGWHAYTTADVNYIAVDDISIQAATPMMTISESSHDYGVANIGSSSTPRTFTATNSGGGTITIADAPTLTGTDLDQFKLVPDSYTYPINLTSGQSAEWTVLFAPDDTEYGEKTANLTIVDNLAKYEIYTQGEANHEGTKVYRSGSGSVQVEHNSQDAPVIFTPNYTSYNENTARLNIEDTFARYEAYTFEEANLKGVDRYKSVHGSVLLDYISQEAPIDAPLGTRATNNIALRGFCVDGIVKLEDNFDTQTDFALSFNNWTQHDGDGFTSYGIEGVDYENAYYTGSYIIFNPATTTPPIADPAFLPYSGSKYAACFAATTAPNDDWLISPQLTFKDSPRVSFRARSVTSQWGMERFQVLYSTTGPEYEKFTNYLAGSASTYVEAPASWTLYEYAIPLPRADVPVWIAIRCVSSDAFAFMVDDFVAGERRTYTLNINSTGTGQPGTEIFKDGDTLGIYTNDTITASLASLLAGTYTPGPAPAGYEWSNPSIVVDAGDFTAGNDYTVTITFTLIETVPVELSSFTAAMFGTNSVHITWVTQSETEVLGFHILRSLEEDLSTALQISNLIPATNTSQTKVYLYKDKDLNQEGTYYYWLQNTELNGETEYHGPINIVYNATQNETPTIPKITGLSTIYPNPFNPSTTIKYSLANAETFDITIYNSRGQIVKVMERAHKEAGNYSAFWNGTDEQGKACGTGVYYVKMQAGKSSFTRKMVLMK
ncbi:MAG: choice-of-anchor J domain-containing protein [Candidatus Cloacimonetes bacterium]|nr:choice-of-anchor J domain-containing protein [Candidatus Cloacimonadota bacterium]